MMNTECQITVVNDLKLIRNAIECFSSTKKKELKTTSSTYKTENFHVLLSRDGSYFCMVINFKLNHLLCIHIHKYKTYVIPEVSVCLFAKWHHSLF